MRKQKRKKGKSEKTKEKKKERVRKRGLILHANTFIRGERGEQSARVKLHV